MVDAKKVEAQEVRMPSVVKEVNALLGKGSEFEGKLTFEGTVRIDGVFSGEIFSSDVLIIGEGAKVKDEIEVATVVINGEVIGNIKAKEAVEIRAPGRLKGNITTPVLQIDRGVIFEGNCSMENITGKMAGSVAAGPTGSSSGEKKPTKEAPPPKL